MKRKKLLFILLLIVIISVGFSAISATLSITGNSTIARNRWDVHFENVQVKSGSATASAPVISNNDTQVTYNVTLNMPGDYYEFTVDAVNEGTIDAMIQTFSNTGLTEAQEKYLSYSIKYADGIGVANKHLLSHGSTETYKVRVEYRTDLEATDLPGSDQTISLTFSVTYEQADSTAVVVRNYIVSYTPMKIGQAIPNEVHARLTPTEAMNDWIDILGETRPFFLKQILSNGVISESYVGFEISDAMASEYPGVTAGTYSLRGFETYDSNAASSNYCAAEYYNSSTGKCTSPNYEENKAILLHAFGSSYCSEDYSGYFDSFECSISDFGVATYARGDAHVSYGSWHCDVLDDGYSYCTSGS